MAVLKLLILHDDLKIAITSLSAILIFTAKFKVPFWNELELLLCHQDIQDITLDLADTIKVHHSFCIIEEICRIFLKPYTSVR